MWPESWKELSIERLVLVGPAQVSMARADQISKVYTVDKHVLFVYSASWQFSYGEVPDFCHQTAPQILTNR